MIKSIIFSVILFLFIKTLTSQIPVGLMHDLDGFPLNRYFDPIIYSSEKNLHKTHNSDSYEIGYYFDKSGNKITGLIMFQGDKFWFKKEGEKSKIKFKPDEIQNFVIGVDSFFTTTKYYSQNMLQTKPAFVQYITEFDDYTIVKHYHFKTFYGKSPIDESFLLKSKNNETWENLSAKYKFKEKALKYFKNVPYLEDKITSKAIKSDDILSIIKMAEYFYKFNNSKPIFYDKYWQETRDEENAEFIAKIVGKNDSIWTFEYYKKSQKLYTIEYSSFYPHVKNGNFTAYYPNGKIRQIFSYKNNRLIQLKFFYESGVLKSQSLHLEKKDDYNLPYIEIKYIAVHDSTGKNILTNNASTITEYDAITRNKYTSVYQNKELTSFYRLLGADTIYQITYPNNNFKTNKLQNRFFHYMSDKKYDDAINLNAQGVILIYLRMNKKGFVEEWKVLNELHPQIDSLVVSFIQSNLLQGADRRFKFKPYKKYNTKKNYEIVIPIEFYINRFYREPINNDYFFQWHQQHFYQMNQQMTNDYINQHAPPGFNY